jgi:dephospho-CoA kinase
MARLIAVSGLAGAGKTTAIDFLETAGFGRRVYVGQLVLDAVRDRGLPPGPQSEKEVRLDLRNKHGLAALAHLAAPHVNEILKSNYNVLLDAVLTEEELAHYQLHCDRGLALIMISASFDIRAGRLSQRSERRLNATDLRTRDDIENNVLRLDRLTALASAQLVNEYSLEIFQRQLESVCRPIK